MPVDVLNDTLQGTGMMLKNISWQLFIQPSEGADIFTEGIHINIYFTIYVYVDLSHTSKIIFYLALEKAVHVDVKVQPPTAIWSSIEYWKHHH